MASKDQVVSVLRATLLSCKGAVTLKQCNRDYRELEGEYIPFSKLGYKSLEGFVSDIPGIKVHKDSYGEIYIDAVASESTKHIAEMVARQKSVSRKSAPRGNYPPRLIKTDSWRKPSAPNSYKSQFYKQYKPNKTFNNNSYSNNNQYSKPTQNYKTPEPSKKNYSESHKAPSNNKTSPPAPASSQPAASTTSSAPSNLSATSASNPPSAKSKPAANSTPVKTPTAEKKYSLTARLEAAVLADDEPPPPASKHSRASSRLSSLRDSLHTDVIPLPLPAAVAPAPLARPQIQKVTVPARVPTPPPDDAKSQVKLEWVCKRHNLSAPVYKINCIKEAKKGPNNYFCIVKIGNEYNASTYPDSSATEDQARELAATKAYLAVEQRLGAGSVTPAPALTAPSLLPTSAPTVALGRLATLVADHHSGIWASTLPDQYREKFNENLPSNWQDLVESSRYFNTDRGVNGQLMILPSNNENGSEWSPLGPASGDYAQPSARTPVPVELGAPVLELPELKLPDESGWNVFITTVNSTIEVWLRLIGEQYSNAYHELLNEMEAYYAHDGDVVTTAEVNSWYAVELDEGWHRALVVEALEDGRVLVFLGDHGDDEVVHVSQLRLLAPKFARLPAQAILCRLEKMEELGASDVGVEIVRQHLVGQVLVAVPAPPSSSADHSVAVALFKTFKDSENEINVNEAILKDFRDFAELKITEKLCEVEVGCVSAEGQVWVVNPTGASLVREALALLTSPGPYHRPLPPAADTPNLNQLYVVRTLSGTWLRCSVRTGLASDDTVSTRLVDSGQTMRAPMSCLVPLASYSKVLALMPHQAKAVRLGSASRAAPQMVERLRELLLNTSVLCRALPSSPRHPASSPPAEPDVELFVRPQGVLASVNSTILFEFEDHKTLVKTEEPKSNPLESLSKKRSRILSRVVSGSRLPDGQPSSQLPPLQLPKPSEWVSVLVTMAANPYNFVVQLTRKQERQQLTEMMAQLQQHCDNSLPEKTGSLPTKGEVYTLLHNKDDSWYRVVVAEVASLEMVSVYFCDFGDLDMVQASQLKKVPDSVPLARSLPPQAVKAKLHGVEPLHQDWSVEDCIRFQQLTVDQEFVALIHEIGSDPLNPTEPLLTIDLVDTKSENDDYLSQKLALEGRANLTAPLPTTCA